jgi:hypothetical protein
MDYSYTKTFRGNIAHFQGKRGSVTIRNSQLQRGTRPTVGLSDALLHYIDKCGITLFVHCLAPDISFPTTAKEWYKTSKREEQKSYFGVPWFIYRGPIPEKAFKRQEEKKILVSMTPDEKERYEYYKEQQNRFMNK